MKRTFISSVIMSGLLWVLVCFPSESVRAQNVDVLREVAFFPELIIWNGKIASMNQNMTFYQAMAVRGSRVWRLGTDAEIRRLAGPQTEMVNMKGRTVIPGIIDAHTHPHLWGLWHRGGSIDEQLERIFVHADNVEQLRSRLSESLQSRARQLGPDQWIIANIPWQLNQYFGGVVTGAMAGNSITREDLDRWAPDNPVMIDSGISESISNSKAIQMEIAEFGQYLRGLRASYTVNFDLILKDKVLEIADFLYDEMAENSAFGLTTFGSHVEPRNVLRALKLLDHQGRMPMRFAWVHREGFSLAKDPVEFYKLLGDITGDASSDYLWNMGVGPESWGGTCGTQAVGLTEEVRERDRLQSCEITPGFPLFDAVVASAKWGLRPTQLHDMEDGMLDGAFQLALESMKGDRALTLDQIRSMKWGFDHGNRIRPEQPAQAAHFGFIMSFQATQFANWRLQTLENYGEKYIPWVQPVKSWMDAGAKFILSTDAHIGRMSDEEENFIHTGLIRDWPYRDSVWPWVAFYVTRELNGRVWTPEERIDRISALRGWTSWAAEYVWREKDIGTLEPGKLADFAVIDRDFFTIPDSEIWNVQNLMTGLGGKIVYRSPNW